MFEILKTYRKGTTKIELIKALVYSFKIEKLFFISYLSYQHCCMLPDIHCLSQGMCLYQVMMTLHFLNVANDAESAQK